MSCGYLLAMPRLPLHSVPPCRNQHICSSKSWNFYSDKAFRLTTRTKCSPNKRISPFILEKIMCFISLFVCPLYCAEAEVLAREK
jgi:hypothetical protein